MPRTRRIGIDLDPQCYGVQACNFFDFEPVSSVPKLLVTVGNPPFGKNACLAVRFFNHAARFSRVIAFVVPRTFRKASLQKRLDRQFHLVLDIELPANSFEFEGAPYDVPCVFQVWERRAEARNEICEPLEHNDFAFTTRRFADFAVRRVGALAGRIIWDFKPYSDASHYFIKARNGARPRDIASVLEKVDWTEAKANNAGNPSISKRELVREYAALTSWRSRRVA